MATQTPVPSRAAIHALRGLLFTTSCSVAFLAEERRRRLKTVKAAAENARKIHAAKVLRGAPVVDGLQPWEARLRERALEIHESNPSWDSSLSPREVQRGIRRKKRRSTRKENQHVAVSDTRKSAAPVPVGHGRAFPRLAVRPSLSASTEQLTRLRPAHRTFSTRRSDPADQLLPELCDAIFKEQRSSTRSSNHASNETSLESLAARYESLDLHNKAVKEPPIQQSHEEMSAKEIGIRHPGRQTWHVQQPVKYSRPFVPKRPDKMKPMTQIGSSADISRFLRKVRQLTRFVELYKATDQGEAYSALTRFVFEEGGSKKLEGLVEVLEEGLEPDLIACLDGLVEVLEPDLIASLASILLTPKWVATGPPVAIELLNAWEAQCQTSAADQDVLPTELCVVRDARAGDWTALLRIESIETFVALAPTALRKAFSSKDNTIMMAVLDRLVDEGCYSPEPHDYRLLELMAIREARLGSWETVLSTLKRAKKARYRAAKDSSDNYYDSPDYGLVRSASIIADLFVENQPAAQHATFLCELYVIRPFRMHPKLIEPALLHFGEQRQLVEYLQWLDFAVSTDAPLDKEFGHVLHRSLEHHWNASHLIVNRYMRPQFWKIMVEEPKVKHRSPNVTKDAKALARTALKAGRRRDYDTVVQAHFLRQEKGLPFRLGWLQWVITAFIKLEGPYCAAADDLIIEARNEGHDVSSLEEWLPRYRLKQGWIGLSNFEHTKRNGFHLSQPIYNSAIRDLVEQKDYTRAWQFICEDAEKHGNGRLAYDEYSLANTLDVLFGFDSMRMFSEIKAILENFISSRAGWHRTNMCRQSLQKFYRFLIWSKEMQNQGLNVDETGAKRYAQLLELKELFSKAYDHVKEARELPEGFDGPGKIVMEVTTILRRDDLEIAETAESPRRRPWFAKSFQEKYMPEPELEPAPEPDEPMVVEQARPVRRFRDVEFEQMVEPQAEKEAADLSVMEEIMRQERHSSHEGPEHQDQDEPQSVSVRPSSRFYSEARHHQHLVATA